MPMPEGSQLNNGVSPVLTSIALSYIPTMDEFIAKKVFPNVPVGAQTGTYNVWKQGDFMRRSMKKLANAEPAPRGGFATSTKTFSVGHYGIGTPYTAQDLAEARRGGLSDQALINAKTYYVTFQAMLELEMETASLIQTSGNWSLSVAGVTSGAVAGTSFLQWDNASSSPVDDIDYLKNRMRLATGKKPNMMIIPETVWLALKKNIQLISRITYGGTMDRPTQVTKSQLAALFGIDTILFPASTYNTAAEGATDSFADIWGKYIWIGYVTPNPSKELPSAGYHFSWVSGSTVGLPSGTSTGAGPASFGAAENPDGIFIREYEEKSPSMMVVESELWTTPNVVASDMGILMTAAIA